MKIAIIGTGGVGGYFGARLAAASNEVFFMARGAHKEALEKDGLILKSINGNLHLPNVSVFDQVGDIPRVDLVILALKAWQVATIAKELQAILHKDSLILPLQNGVSTVEELSEIYSPLNVLAGLCRIFSFVKSPGVIKHVGVEPTIIFGEQDSSKSKMVQAISKLFTEAGINNQVPDDIQAARWKKFISICLSGLMAVSKTTYGELRSIPEMRVLMFQLMKENLQVAQAMGINLEDEYVDKAVSIIDTFKFEATASMARDIWAGNPSELHYQNGTVVKLGEKFNVDTPVNRFVYYTLLPREMKASKNKG